MNSNSFAFLFTRRFLRVRYSFWILALIAALIYSNSVKNGFNLDDEFYTAGGTKTTARLVKEGFSGIPGLFKNPTFEHSDGTSYSYRPVVGATFAIEYALWGENAHVSHSISILLYVITVLLFLKLLQEWLPGHEAFSFLTCLIFTVHPLHTEVVDNIKSRDELLMLLFGVSTLYFGWRWFKEGKIIFVLIYPACLIISLLSKSSGLVFIPLLPLSLWYFGKASWKKILISLIPLAFAAFAVKLMMLSVTPDASRKLLLHENPLAVLHPGWAVKLATGIETMGRYIYLFLLPHPLLFYYGYSHVDLAHWTDLSVIISALLIALLLFLTYKSVRERSVSGFGILIFFICIFPFSNLVFAAPGMIAERFAYGASLGLSMLFVWLFFDFLPGRKWISRSTGIAILIVISILFSIRTIVRNNDWKSKRALYSHDIEWLENSANANLLYAMLLSTEAEETGDLSELQLANQHFLRVTEITADYPKAYNNLARNLVILNDVRGAVAPLRKSVALDPKNKEACYNLGVVYQKLGESDSALHYLNRVIQIDPAFAAAYVSLSVVTDSTSQFAISDSILKTGLLNCSEKSELMSRWGDSYLSRKDTSKAVEYYENAIRENRDHLGSHQRLLEIHVARHDLQNTRSILVKYLEALRRVNAQYIQSGNNTGAQQTEHQINKLQKQKIFLDAVSDSLNKK